MSTLTATVEPTGSVSSPLPRTLRIGLAVAAPHAPLAQGTAYLVSPYGNADDPEVILTAVAGAPAAVICSVGCGSSSVWRWSPA